MQERKALNTCRYRPSALPDKMSYILRFQMCADCCPYFIILEIKYYPTVSAFQLGNTYVAEYGLWGNF